MKETNQTLKNLGFDAIKNPLTLEELLQKPDVKIAELISIDPRLNDIEEDVAYQVELNVKYRGYIERQNEMVKRTKRLEDIRIPPDLVYRDISGISNEIVERFTKVKPFTLGQASRIPGVTPAAITALMIHFKKTGILR